MRKQVGLQKSQIFIADKGDIVEFKNGKMRMSGRVQAGNVLIDGIGVGDVGNIVLRDRKLLSQDGIFIVVVTLNRAQKKIASGPEILSRGFVYVRESEQLMTEAADIARTVIEKYVNKETFEWTNIKQEIRDTLNHIFIPKNKTSSNDYSNHYGILRPLYEKGFSVPMWHRKSFFSLIISKFLVGEVNGNEKSTKKMAKRQRKRKQKKANSMHPLAYEIIGLVLIAFAIIVFFEFGIVGKMTLFVAMFLFGNLHFVVPFLWF